MRFLLLLLPIHLSLIPAISHASVWDARNSWNESWENQYAQWIAHDVNEDFLVPIKLPVDCAELAYVIRAVFSRNTALPFLASGAGGGKIGHFMNNFDELPTARDWHKDGRFLAFLRFLTQHVTTKSYPYDTYPVHLCRETVQPGLMLYEDIIASHACLVGRVEPDQIIPVIFFESSVPARVRFHQTTQVNVYVYPVKIAQKDSGIVRWRWPVSNKGGWSLLPAEKMPYYSREIYDASFPFRTELRKALNRVVKSATAGSPMTTAEHIQELVKFFQDEIQFRAQIIKKAEEILKSHPSLRSEEFDYTYNTDSRDERLYGLVRTIWEGIHQYDIPRQDFFRALQLIPVSISKSLPDVNLLLLFIAADRHWISSDAYLSPEERWGISWDADTGDWILNNRYTSKEILPWYDSQKEKSEYSENKNK